MKFFILKNINKKNCNTFLYKYYIHFLFIISYITYYISLEGCFDGEELCGNNMNWIYKKLIELIISCEILSFVIATVIFNISSKYHLVHLIVVFGLFVLFNHGFFFFYHGMYNFIFFLLLFILNIIVILIIKLVIFILRIKNKKFTIVKLLIISIFFLLYNFKSPDFKCDGWEKGLNNTSIENNEKKYGCNIKIPKFCPYRVFSRYQDYTKIFGINCSKKKSNSRKIILKKSKSSYISKKTKKFGFPLTNEGLVGCLDGLDTKILKKYVLDNLFDVENNFNNFSQSEIIVDFSKDPYGELLIDVKYNDSLSKERKKLENDNPYSNNILILFLDSVSRAGSMRQLNKTLKFVEKFISYEGGYNEKYPNEKFHSFQFFKYHSFEGRTAGNFPRLFFGNRRESKNILRMNKYFKDNGFITNYCSHHCKKDNSRTLHDATLSELYDHQMLLCDPNAPRYHKPYRKCLYGKDDIGFLLDYSEQFWRKYKNNRKYSLIVIDTAHESTMEVLKYIDEILYNFLYSLYDDNLFKDSSIFLLGDHGIGLPSIYYIFKFYSIESVLPMLYVIINDRKNISYNEQYYYLQQNQQTFITAYDIYNTINHLLYGNKYKYISNLTDENPTPKSSLGSSLFEKINQKLRKAKNYEFMQQNICI